MREILFIDKPKGITSHDVVGIVRKSLKSIGGDFATLKVGHAGTLDPLASGLLILGIGSGTKRLDWFLKLEKRYTVEIKMGESRTTGDMEGEIVEIKEVTKLQKDVVKQVLWDVQGTVKLPVPKYSAVKVDGKALYKKARAGEEFEPPVRDMRIYQAKLLFFRRDLGENVITVRLEVASGVYIRSIVEEIGRKLGYPAVTMNLRRTKIGRFVVRDAWSIEDVQNIPKLKEFIERKK